MLFRDLFLAVAANPAVAATATRFPAFKRMSRRFVAGETLDEAFLAVAGLRSQGLQVSLDHLGESVTEEEMAAAAARDYLAALDRIRESGLHCHISIKLTQMGLDLGRELCLRNVQGILQKAREVGTFVRIDMEASPYTERTLDIYHTLHQQYDNVGVVIQSYLRRSQDDVEKLAAAGANIRLCKGAYSEPAGVAFPRKADVDANYLRLLEIYFRPESLASGAYVAVATHDPKIIQWTTQQVEARGIRPQQLEFQMLYGIRRDLQLQLAAKGYTVRIYVPYGSHWYPYLTRRLAERPANVFFILKCLLRG